MPRPKPRHLTPYNAAAFQYESVARRYRLRPPYPDEVFTVLGEYFGAGDAVLDLGCGTGDIARRLADRAARVDAVDPSAAMVSAGKRLPGGTHPNLHWHVGNAEDFGYPSPYSLVVASLSLHWMDWSRVLDAMRAALAPRGRLAVIHGRTIFNVPWREALRDLVRKYSVMTDFEEHDVIEELSAHGFAVERRVETEPVPFRQSLEDYVESWHSRAGFVRERMGTDRTAEFDRELRRAVDPFAAGGEVALDVVARMAVGILADPGRSM